MKSVRQTIILMAGWFLLLSACSQPAGSPSTTRTIDDRPISTTDLTPLSSPIIAASQTPTFVPRPTTIPLLLLTPSPTPTVTEAISPTSSPTYVKLRGTVIVAQANCRYGPGYPYLYKYGLLEGNRLEIIGRNDSGTWIEVQAIGGSNPCWVKADLMKIQGDVMTVMPIAPEDVLLPMSPYYGPLQGVSATRHGDEVIVSWKPLMLRAGDDSEQFPYLIEAWVCQSGKIVFTPLGTYDTMVKITDQPGCLEPSHARVYGVEKHGYTRWVQVAWPQAITPNPITSQSAP